MKKTLLPAFSLKRAVLLPLVLVLIILFSGFISSFINQEKGHTKKAVGEQFLSAKRALDTAVKIDTEKLSAALEIIDGNPELKRAMMADDRDALLKQSGSLFTTLREKYSITHFYFHRPDRVNFLRVHQPDRYGDRINRFSALQAEATGEPASALEIGPLGLYTLRVVFPWYENEKLIGYVELGEEIEHLYKRIKDVINLDLYVIIDKRILSPKDWEAGMKMLGRKAEWDFMPESVIAFTTVVESNATILKRLMESGNLDPTIMELSGDERIFETYSLPLTDAGQTDLEIGKILFLRDVTAVKKHSIHHILFTVGLGIAISGILLLFFFLLTRRIEQILVLSKKDLVQSEARFRSMVESSSDWIWEVDASMRYVYTSPKIKELLGYEADEIIGKTPLELMPEEEAGRIAKEFAAIVKERRPFAGLENTNRHKDGRIVIMETSGVPIVDEAGTLMGYRGIDRDITERKHAEEALKIATERFVLHFEQSPLAIIEWDTDFNVAEWNPAAERIFGYTKAEAKGRAAMDLIIPENVKSQVSEIWADLLSGEGGYRNTNENMTKEGNVIICEWYNTPLVDEEGQVLGVASVAEDVTEQKHAEERITHMAYYDALTGLPNRTLFKDRLEQECRIADRSSRFVGVMFIDINYFKNVNETLGHLVGDLLLQAVAQRLKESFRKSDTVALFGGDEFAVVIPGLVDVDEIEHVIQSVTDRFKVPFAILEYQLFVAFSIGYSFYPLDDSNIDNLLRNADTAMNRAKELGPSHHQRYSIEMTDRASMHLSMHNGLRRALNEGELVLHYQPQTDLKSGVMTGVEALVRWQHPQEGLISPAQFIPVAEETGLIVPMGEWILRTACLQAKGWQEQGLTPFTMAVNLSSRQFKEEGFAQSVIEIIHETGVEPKYIELELTESILIDNEYSVRKSLDDFKNAGISLSIDDFGTGYSSLSYLKRFPIDKLKIDQSFIRDVIVDKSEATLVRAIISMAKALELKTIAEGVETQEQLDFLRAEGCEEVQGYLLGRPMPAEQLQDFLKNR
ncbi:MAG: EAL domain-containing protein [Sulfurimonadaceae bacterium]